MSDHSPSLNTHPHLARMLAESASVLIWIADTDKLCTYFNNAWLSFRGRTTNEEYGFGWLEGVHPEDKDRCLDVFSKAFDAREPFSMDYRLMRFDGMYRWIRDDGAPTFDTEGEFQGYVGSCLDITEMIDSQQRIEESEQRFQHLVNAIDEVFWMTDIDITKMIYVSPAFEKVWQLKTEDLYKEPKLFIDAIHPDDKAGYLDILASHNTKGLSYECHYRIVRGENDIRWISERGYPVKSQNGSVAYMAGICTDTTEQRELEDRVHHSEKIDAINQLAGGIAHDFNNQLVGILGYADLLLKDLSEPRLNRYADNIIWAARRASDVTAKLLAFTRKGQRRSVAINIHDIIDETTEMLAHSIDKLIQIEKNLTSRQATSVGDPSQIQNVILNLALNARDAMPDGGTLTFKTEQVVIEASSKLKQAYDLAEGDFIAISVIDSGTGLSEEIKSRLFEPYFTTKEEGKGTGMGLASAWGTVAQHGGCIVVRSEPGNGATFTVYLPLSQTEETGKTSQNAIKSDKQTGAHTILVVDDEEVIRDLCCEFLNEAGYTTITAANGQEAVELYARKWRSIDIVILDMIMPNMDGLEAFRAMKNVNPDVKVVLSSGYSLEESSQSMIDEGIHGFIQKPFKINDFLQTLKQVGTDYNIKD